MLNKLFKSLPLFTATICLIPGLASACSLSFTSPASGSTSQKASITVTGTGSGDADSGDYGSVTATVNGQVFFQYSGKFTSIVQFLQSGQASAPLSKGRNHLRVSGSVGGCSASDSMVVFYSPPLNGAEKEQGEASCKAGNPISIGGGNKYQLETILSSVIPLELHYNSIAQEWRHSFQSSFIINNDKANLLTPSGKGLIFSLNNGEWLSDSDIFYRVTDLGSGASPRWELRRPNGVIERYDQTGRLYSLVNLSGETTSLSYFKPDSIFTLFGETKVLTQHTTVIQNHLGDILLLSYGDNGHLSSAQLNNEVNHSFNFDAEGRLLSRTDNEGNTTQYHYEDTRFPNHLTGITGPDGKRFASWAYDDQGRGIMSEHAGQEHVELVFNTDGSTTVTNELGKQTTYHFTEIEGLKRPTLIEGHATANCVGSNKAYTYYPSGLLETKTDWAGNTTRYEYNDRGLITLIAEAEGSPQERITTQVWDSTKPLLLERVQGSQRTRFSYNSTNQLTDTTQDSLQ
ncbi:hypothetical protein [Amphritea pacifica]|uniref:Teneurin-like YD-shell domain-containing protein n=1 Tax=Amphritea pacifica TaxID=2811233 RepID=A0ABS2WE32_9GAMM|nr:hypothetical protein [Amphritea pacifica]MBN0989811.1 hypothetical protein [Amphritea pacifica]